MKALRSEVVRASFWQEIVSLSLAVLTQTLVSKWGFNWLVKFFWCLLRFLFSSDLRSHQGLALWQVLLCKPLHISSFLFVFGTQRQVWHETILLTFQCVTWYFDCVVFSLCDNVFLEAPKKQLAVRCHQTGRVPSRPLRSFSSDRVSIVLPLPSSSSCYLRRASSLFSSLHWMRN